VVHAIFTASHIRCDRRTGIFRAFFRLMAAWRRRRRDLRCLAHLDERALRDIGIDRSLTSNDSAIPFWSLQISRDIML